MIVILVPGMGETVAQKEKAERVLRFFFLFSKRRHTLGRFRPPAKIEIKIKYFV
jgi:hypothetical protein